MIDAGLEIRWARVGQKYNYRAAVDGQGHRMYQIHKMVFDFAAQQKQTQRKSIGSKSDVQRSESTAEEVFGQWYLRLWKCEIIPGKSQG